jgi:hypothetical protein
MATDTAVAPPPLSRGAPAAPRDRPANPTRHLWQLPVLLVGILGFVSVWQGWLKVDGTDPESEYARVLAELKARYEKVTVTPAALKEQLTRVANDVETYREQAPLARFYLGSGYVRLAELTADPEEARGYWTLAQQHFSRVTDMQLRDQADRPKLAFRAAKARAGVGLAPDTPEPEVVLLMNVLSTPQPGEDAGETQRLVAKLALRRNPPDYARAKLALTVYVQGGLSTPAASLARGRLQLAQVYITTKEYADARKVLFDIGADAPPDVFGPAKVALAQVLMADGAWSEAAKELDVLRGTPGVSPAERLTAAYQLGVCKLRDRKWDEAARMFEEAAKGEGHEAQAAAIQLADLYLRGTDQARHKAAVDLLAAALKGVSAPSRYELPLIPLNEVQATFELAVTTLLNDGAYESALSAADVYERVSAPGRYREKRAEVLGKWGEALKKTLGDPKPKFQEAAAEFALLSDSQPKTDGKLDMLRRSAQFSRLADDARAAATRLELAVALPDIPEPILPTVWLELADAKLAAGDLKDIWRIFNLIMASRYPLSTAVRYRLARQFVDSRHPGLVGLGLQLFEQIAKQQTIRPEEREFHERAITELANAQIREGNFADAENRLRTQLGLYPTGPEAGLARLLLGVCLLQRAAAPRVEAADATKMRNEALGLFKKNVTECDLAERRNGKLTDRETWLRLQSALRVLQAHQQLRTEKSARDLLYDAGPLLERHRGTVEELIILSLMYHAFRQVNDNREALVIRERMKEVFDKLPASAFSQQPGEYSRDYWLTVWFAPDKK